jgi:hypothetical protein
MRWRAIAHDPTSRPHRAQRAVRLNDVIVPLAAVILCSLAHSVRKKRAGACLASHDASGLMRIAPSALITVESGVMLDNISFPPAAKQEANEQADSRGDTH